MLVYFACILKHSDDDLYDVGLIRGDSSITETSQFSDLILADYGLKVTGATKTYPFPEIVGREVIYVEKIISDIKPNNKEMNKYMKWKIGHCQVSVGDTPATAHRGLFTNVKNDLEWIISVIKVEIDYHLGAQICMLPKNSKYIKAYQRSAAAGYGPQFFNAAWNSLNKSNDEVTPPSARDMRRYKK